MKLSKLTTIVIVTINGKITNKVIKNLYENYKIIIVENNNDQKFKKRILNSFKKIKVLTPKKKPWIWGW